MSGQPVPNQRRRASFHVEGGFESSESSSGSSASDQGAFSQPTAHGGGHPLAQPPPLPHLLGYAQQPTGGYGTHRGGGTSGAQRGRLHGAQRGGGPPAHAPPPAAHQYWQQQPPAQGSRGQPPARGVYPTYTRGADRPVFVGRGFLPPGGNSPYIGGHAAGGQSATVAPSPSPPGSGSPGSYPDIVNPGRGLSGLASFSGLSDGSSSDGSSNWGEVRVPGSATKSCTMCGRVYYIAHEAEHMSTVHGIRG